MKMRAVRPSFVNSGICLSAVLCLSRAGLFAATDANWETSVTATAPGSFSPSRAMHAKYGFGWSGFPGGSADIRLTKPSPDRLQVDARLRTIGFVRALWKFDASHRSIVDGHSLRPIEVKQTETARSKTMTTNLAFDSKGVTSKRIETGAKAKTKIQRFDFPSLFDLQSALLYVRSQPLQDGSVQRIVVYPASSAYQAKVSVLGRERLTTPAGTYNAIKLDLQLNKIGKDRGLEPHRKFRHATGWLSDDADRLLLKIEAQIFVGTVVGELQSVEFEKAPDGRVD